MGGHERDSENRSPESDPRQKGADDPPFKTRANELSQNTLKGLKPAGYPPVLQTLREAIERVAQGAEPINIESGAGPVTEVPGNEALPSDWIDAATHQKAGSAPPAEIGGFMIGEGRIEVAGGGALHGARLSSLTDDHQRRLSSEGSDHGSIPAPRVNQTHCSYEVRVDTSYTGDASAPGWKISGTLIDASVNENSPFYFPPRRGSSTTTVRIMHHPGTHCEKVVKLGWTSGLDGSVLVRGRFWRWSATAAAGGSGTGDHQYGPRRETAQDDSIMSPEPFGPFAQNAPVSVRTPDKSGVKAGNEFVFTMKSEGALAAKAEDEPRGGSSVRAWAYIQHRFHVYAFGEAPKCELHCDLYEEDSGIVAVSWNCEGIKETKVHTPPVSDGKGGDKGWGVYIAD